MSPSTEEERARILAEVIAARRSIRVFSEAMPARRDVERVIAAGVGAPYAAAMSPEGRLDRRFFVVSPASAALSAVVEAVKAHARRAVDAPETPAPLRDRLQPVAEGRIPGVGSAPYYIVVAERQSLAASQSLAHALENMWLTATALGLGMQLVSLTATMSDDAAFCEIIGLPVGEYALNGCVVGVPAQAPAPRPVPDAAAMTRWLD